MQKRYFYNIDFLRFIFCISILLMHFSRFTVADISSYVYQMNILKNNFSLGYICVEFFFIISGFLWCLGTDRQISLFEFAKKKIIRFFPLMLFAVLCAFVFSKFDLIIFEPVSNIFALSFLSGLNFRHFFIVNELGNIYSCWYISVLFWVLLFYQYMYTNWKRRNFNLFIAIIIIIGYEFLTTVRNGDLDTNLFNYYGLLNYGLIRGLCAIAIGYLIGEVYKTYYSKIQNMKLSFIGSLILLSVNACALFYIFLNIFYITSLPHNNDIFFVYCFAVVMLCFVFNKDLLSRFLNNKYFAFIGRYSLAIYVMHNICMDVFAKVLFSQKHITILQAHPYLLFYLAIIISVLVGIIAYYLVEKPATKYLTKELENIK